MKSKHLIIVIGLAGVVFWFATRTPDFDEAPTLRSKPKSETVVMPKNQQVQEELKKSSLAGKKLRLQHAIGLSPVAKTKSGKWHFDVRLQSMNNQCRTGDFDIISNDLKLVRGQKLFLTVESLADNSILYQEPLDLSKTLGTGFNRSITIPAIKNEAQYMGVFICSKRDDKQPCLKQKIVNVNKIDALQKKAILAKKAYPRSGKVFFFQFLTAFDGQLSIFDMGNRLESHFRRMEKAFRKLDPSGDYRRPFHKAKFLTQSIGSMKPMVLQKQITFFIPKQSNSCVAEQRFSR
ncbi:hypothetical protein [Pseudobacteriovorax antillogorgiicola]|uniref:Uncharacterized protein n=1 Tax=Pseudobacteriovorax antillogorgiicola TaxID=1513793 RepID=A0A1Y6CJF8_9BACT|nr:hypothetical protein [Pseudobacteriovorax antillogorgiicola]TCS46631.1 hypothetical protein EDD56_1237 [Pseudobacteriovorax antillogorgiicola]SMF66110.1 hypothetical protein SAMN06296036_1237 [Pseudobacteriovorax antillogorgiicola]